MSRELRMVPPGFEHPVNKRGDYIPLFNGLEFKGDMIQYERSYFKWRTCGEWRDGYGSESRANFNDYEYNPKPHWYTSPRDARRCTHYMMYETTTEGTPISPAFDNPEILARFLAETGASAFGNRTATYEQWMNTINRGSTVSAILTSTGLISGVELP